MIKTICKKCGDLLRLLEDVIGVGGMCLFGAMIIYEVIVRAFGIRGIPWLQEFSQYMFVISVFIGSSRAVESDDHMVMDMLYRTTPAKFHRPMQCFVDLLMVAVSFAMLYFTYKYWAYLGRMGTSTQSVTNIKMTAIWAPILFCMATMTIRYIVVFVKRTKAYVTELKAHELKKWGE